MALRGFVTGSDMCTTSDGAGPSNAMGTLADNLLGRRGKEQRLQELPGVQGFAAPGALMGDTAQAAARAAFDGELAHVPGLSQVGARREQAAADAFLAGGRPMLGPPGVDSQFAEFDRIFQEGRMDRPMGTAPLVGGPLSGPPAPLTPFLHVRAHAYWEETPVVEVANLQQ
eukprot:jgi/Botrbrau1/4469/Bobra.0220s0003.1